MKKAMISIAAAIVCVASAHSSTLCVYRRWAFTGGGTPWAVFLDGRQLAILPNAGYVRLEIKPGEYTLSNTIDTLRITIRQGQNFYVRLRPFFSAKGYKFNEMSEAAGKAEIATLRRTNINTQTQ
jgi:hypothetical protein